jgi:hypothetical protein
MSTPIPEKTQKSASARRRLFQILAVGGTAAVVLPEKWVKPVVDAVIVPAHAAGSVVRAQGIFGNSVSNLGMVDSGRSGLLERFAGLLMSSAYAVVGPGYVCGALTNPQNVCISFDIAAAPVTSVQVFAEGSANSATIYPNNTISNVTVGSLSFANITANSLYVSGLVTTSNLPNCTSEAFSFPRLSSNACFVQPT